MLINFLNLLFGAFVLPYLIVIRAVRNDSFLSYLFEYAH